MDTRAHILDEGERLMKRAGYQGFSYADVARGVGVRKASVHHHFPTKADLAEAAVARYRARGAEALAEVPVDDLDEALAGFGRIFVQGYEGPGHGCLCGSLVADWETLPEPVRAQVRAYWHQSERWLGEALRRADPDAERATVETRARLVFSLFEGAMLSARVHEDGAVLERAIEAAQALAQAR